MVRILSNSTVKFYKLVRVLTIQEELFKNYYLLQQIDRTKDRIKFLMKFIFHLHAYGNKPLITYRFSILT